MNTLVQNYINFSKKEAIGAIVLACIVIPLAVLPFFKNTVQLPETEFNHDWTMVSSALEKKDINNNASVSADNRQPVYYSDSRNENDKKPVSLFKFDPNTASPEALKALGLRDKTIQILCNYRNKGGRFKIADDLKKIYGLRPDEFERLRPYIAISLPPSTHYHNQQNKQYRQQQDYTPVASEPVLYKKTKTVNINRADTADWKSLYGIGSKLAARIVNFRSKLGGFYSVEQVGETYGVPDNTFQQVKPYLKLEGEAGIIKMKINEVGYDQLNAHPYISSKLAYLIMKYRKEHGSIADAETLKELVAKTTDSYEKLINYISF
ncbi:MAG: helix-hairpin-helix domain-containing protein [Niabella sp.]